MNCVLNVVILKQDPEEFLFFLQNNQNDGSELGATALPAEQPPAFEIFDNADSPSLVSELFGLDDDEHGLPRYETEEDLEWSLAQEEASLSFYKVCLSICINFSMQFAK